MPLHPAFPMFSLSTLRWLCGHTSTTQAKEADGTQITYSLWLLRLPQTRPTAFPPHLTGVSHSRLRCLSPWTSDSQTHFPPSPPIPHLSPPPILPVLLLGKHHVTELYTHTSSTGSEVSPQAETTQPRLPPLQMRGGLTCSFFCFTVGETCAVLPNSVLSCQLPTYMYAICQVHSNKPGLFVSFHAGVGRFVRVGH